MRSNLLRIGMLVSSVICLTSCPKEKEIEPAASVTANAGSDQNVQVGQTVTLDGSSSKDSKSAALTYSWTFTGKPTGSTVTLTGPANAKPTFVPDMAGDYEVELTASSANGQAKDKVKVTATGSNATSVVLSSRIAADRVLADIFTDPNVPDYFVTADVEVAAKLTIQPGVVIAFEPDKALYVLNQPQGAIIAKGTAQKKIVFTGKTKSKGSWKGIMIYSASSQNEFDHVEVSYGGSSNLTGVSVKSNLVVYGNATPGGTLKITNSTFSNSGGYGFYIERGQATLASFSNNTVSGNTGNAAFVDVDQLDKLDAASKFTGNNGYNGVEISGEVPAGKNATWPAFADGSKYYVSNTLELTSPITIAPGAVFEFDADKAMYVKSGGGAIIAKGTAQNKIVFTGKTKSKGSWKGIMIYSASSQNEFDHVEVSYGGASNLVGVSVKSNLVIYGNATPGGNLKITNSAFTNSGGYGLYVERGQATLASFSNNTVSGNTGNAAFVDVSQLGKLDAASKFTGNNGYDGVETSGEVEANNNATWPAFADGSKYYVSNTVELNSAITIAPGAVFEFNTDKALYVNGGGGAIIAKGTSQNKIVFTGKTKSKGTWKGIMIYSASSQNEFDHVEVSYGGASNLVGVSVKSNLVIYGNATPAGNLKITNSAFTNSGGYGLYVERNASVNSDAGTSNSFAGNTSTGYQKQQ